MTKYIQAKDKETAEDIARGLFRRDQYLDKVIANINGKRIVITRKAVFGEKV